MNSDDLRNVVSKAINSTKSKTIQWKEGSDDQEFQVDFARSSLVIWYQSREYERYGFLVRNSSGKIISSLFAEGSGDIDFDLLSELYNTARNSLLGADETLDDVLEGLEGKSLPDNTGFIF